jgi:hypothetical protein
MGLTETLVFYLVVGIAVAVALWSADAEPRGPSALARWFRAATAVAFWPVYLPILLTPPRAHDAPPSPPGATPDELSFRICEVERELDAAFSSLDGWAEQALSRERERIAELRCAWNWQAQRIGEMDDVLRALPPMGATTSGELASWPETLDRVARSEHSRQQNLARLRQIREQAYEDLTATLARVRELISLMHLAKFTGAPASRADELVLQIAVSVEGLSEVAQWRSDDGETITSAGANAATEAENPQVIGPSRRSSILCGESRG